MGSFLKRFACVLVSGVLAVSICASANAQQFKKSTNPYVAAELERMRHPGNTALQQAPGVPQAFRPWRSATPQPWKQTRETGSRAKDSSAQPSSSAPTPYFPGFNAPSYTPITYVGDSNAVYASATADFDKKNGPDVVAVQLDGTLSLAVNDGHGHLTRTQSNTSAVPLNANVVYIEAADLNKDGYPDVVAVDAANSALLVYLNKGNGTFANVVSIPVSPASGAGFMNGGSIAVADVNGDGIPDVVAVTNINVENGKTQSTYTTTFSQQTFLGRGDGTFTTPASSVDTVLPGLLFIQFGHSMALADLNGDHIPDLVTEYFDAINASATITGSLGKGNGTFAPIATSATVPSLLGIESAMQVADLNGDGKADVVFLPGDGAYVALGRGDGTFAAPTIVLPNLPYSRLIQLGDFNGDGDTDLVVYNAGSIAVYPGNGDGTFKPVPFGELGANLTGDQEPSPADFDGDGNLDVAVTDDGYNTVSIYRGSGDGRFAASLSVGPSNQSPTLPNNLELPNNFLVLAAGKVNANGKMSILAYDYTAPFLGPYGSYPPVDIGTFDGKNGFTFSTVLSGYDLFLADPDHVVPALVDLNHDGYPDLIIITARGVSVALSNADGTRGPVQPISLPIPVKGCTFGNIDIGDINNDGNPDLLMDYEGPGGACTPEESPSGYFVALGDGKGGFKATFTPYGDTIYQTKLVDLDGDGKLDMVVDDKYVTGTRICFSCTTPITALRGNGDGTFDAAHPISVLTDWRIAGFVIGDFDADGVQDLTLLAYTQKGPSGAVPDSQGILLLKGRGDFTFEDPKLIAVDTFETNAQYADINGDGLPDLLFSVDTSFQDVPTYFGLTALPNLGGGSFGPPINYLEPEPNTNTLVGDFNGDGALDVLSAPFGPPGIAPALVFLNQGGTTLSLAPAPATSVQGDPVSLVATLSVLPGTAVAEGNVSFSTNGTLLGTTDLIGGTVAQLTTTSLPVGSDPVIATYSGDANHNPSTTQPVNVSVQALAPAFTLSATPQTLTVTSGQPGKVTLALSADPTFNGQITVSCSGLPTGASCSFDPATLTLVGSQTGQIVATISSANSTQAKVEAHQPGWLAALGGMGAVQCIVLMWPSRRRRILRSLAAGTGVVLSFIVFMAISGCGGSGSGTGQTQPPPTTTTSTLVTMTATATSGGVSLTQTVVVPVIIRN